jgi:thioredoxin-related protein/YHS domain-containing protein
VSRRLEPTFEHPEVDAFQAIERSSAENPVLNRYRNINSGKLAVKHKFVCLHSIITFFPKNPRNRLKCQSPPNRTFEVVISVSDARIVLLSRGEHVNSRYFHVLWLTLALVCGSVLAEDGIRWAPDIAQARRASIQFKVPLLIHFYGDHCLPCKTLEQRVLSQKEVIDDLNKYFICVRVNATQDRKTAAEFQVHSWPTDVFVSPDGKTLYQGVCQQDVRGYIGILENIAVMNRDRNIMLAAASGPTAPGAIAQQTFPVGNAPMTASQLPAPGANTLTSSQTPNFYTAPETSQFQQLSASTSPGRGVQSGPLLAGGQPAGITGSTPGLNQQIAPPDAAAFNQAANGQLPPRAELQAQLASPMDSRGTATRMAGYPQVTAEPATPNMQPQPIASASQTEFNNPYYPQQPTNSQASHAFAGTAGGSSNATPSMTLVSAAKSGTAPSLDVAIEIPDAAGNNASTSLIPSNSFQPRDQTPSIDSIASAPTKETTADPETAGPGVGGYCPVTLRTSGQWVEGSPEFVVRHRGKIYWMSSEQALQEFLKAPDASSPVLSGYDPMVFLTEGKLVDGDIRFGLHEEVGGTIMLFANEASKKTYEQSYDKNTKALNVILQAAGAR